MTTAVIIAASTILSAICVGVVRRYALQREVLDRPNERSSHAVPTPRGGGAGFVVAFLLVVCFASGTAGLVRWQFGLALAGLVLTALVGWRDDHGGLGVRLRLGAHVLAGASVLPLVYAGAPVPHWMGFMAWAWWVFWAVAAINVVNFMDGIDGLVGSQMLIFGVHLEILGRSGAATTFFGAALAGACLGFLLWNWAPAKIFLGDAGSGALGLIAVTGGALVMVETDNGLVAAFLPLYPLFLDASITLARRALRGERIWVAHRSHLYQRLANGGLGHARVTLGFGAAACIGLLVTLIADNQLRLWLDAGYFLFILCTWTWLDRSTLRWSAISSPR
jgi:UDP-N-acetylmuramyl pentapeptide phosphotransferase/UDP-N-acetylglucosamine-1-phosphate transferase